MPKVFVCAVFLACVGFGLPASAADMASAGWNGEYLAAADGTAVATSTVTKGLNALDVRLTLDRLEASADGDRTEGSASYTGEILAMKPSSVRLPTIHVTLSGLIVKTPGSTARIDLVVGDARKTIEWAKDQAASVAFEESVTATAVDKALTSPIPVKVLAFAGKQPGSGAVLVAVKQIAVTITEASSVASLAPNFAH